MIVYVEDVQRSKRTIEFDSETDGKNQLAKEAELVLSASSSLNSD